MGECYREVRAPVEDTVDEQTDPAQGGGRPWVAVILSVLLHAALILVGYLAHDGASGAGGGDPFSVDVEVAPEAPEAEMLPDELAQQERPITDRDVVVPEPPPAPPAAPEEPDEPEEPETDDSTIGLDAGVDAATEPADGGTEIADEDRARDAGVGDAGALALDENALGDAGARDAGTTATAALGDAGAVADDGGTRVATSTAPGGVADGGVPSATFGEKGGTGAGAAG